MTSERLVGLVQISRPANCAIAFASVVVAAVLAGASTEDSSIVLVAATATWLIAAGGYAINDYFDVQIDRINKPDRPIPRGALLPRHAKLLWMILSALGLILASTLPQAALLIAAFWVIGLYVYAMWLKRTVFTGNLFVALATGLAFVYGAVAVGYAERSVVPAVFAFLVNLGREVVKDVEDREADAAQGAVTLPVRFGVRPALLVTTVTLVLLIVATLLAYAVGVYNRSYLMIILPTDVLLTFVVVSMWQTAAPTNMKRLSLLLKASMVLGLMAMYVGS